MATRRELIFEEQAREKLCEGIEKLADVVGITLGPEGRNVGLQSSWGAPTITSSGNTVLKDVEFKDQYLDMGASIGKEVAVKMKEHCGDGVTTAILLLRALVKAGIKNIESGATPVELKRGMDKAFDAIVKELENLSIPVKNDYEIKNIAMNSAGGIEEVGTLVAETFGSVGWEGVIVVEEGKGTETVVDVVKGMQFDRGYVSPFFCTNSEDHSVEMNNVKILIVDKKIDSTQEMLPLLQQVAGIHRELLIIADDIEGEALSTLIINKLKGVLRVCAIKAPGFGDERRGMNEDLAILTGATVVAEGAGMTLRGASIEVLGEAEKVVISKEKTTIIGGKGVPGGVESRVRHLEEEGRQAKSSYERERFEKRKGRLSGGIAVIRAGGLSEPEMKKKKQVLEDSLNSTKAALEGGILSGGGSLC